MSNPYAHYDIDPELASILEFIPPMTIEDVEASRTGFRDMIAMMSADLDTSGVDIRDLTIPGSGDQPDVNIRLYSPSGLTEKTAGIVYIHGGGFVIGDLESEHAMAVQLCRDLGVILASVDYRLAPEHPYPAGLEDCYSTLCWLSDESVRLNVDKNRIAVMGQSAGGGLSAGLALLTRDRNGPPLCFQMLGIPELDYTLQTHSMNAYTDTPMWNRPNAVLSWKYYLGENPSDVPIYASPYSASVEQLKGLPSAYVTTMQFDPLRDEGIEYALRLSQAGVAVDLHNFPGTFHGSSMVADAAVSKRQHEELLSALRRALNPD